ncbi:unnamed protein product [Lampetra fluviatilis]
MSSRPRAATAGHVGRVGKLEGRSKPGALAEGAQAGPTVVPAEPWRAGGPGVTARRARRAQPRCPWGVARVANR